MKYKNYTTLKHIDDNILVNFDFKIMKIILTLTIFGKNEFGESWPRTCIKSKRER